MLSKAFQHLPIMANVVFSSFAVDKNIGQINDNRNVEEFSENFIHELLE
jgi:hypothetical protein